MRQARTAPRSPHDVRDGRSATRITAIGRWARRRQLNGVTTSAESAKMMKRAIHRSAARRGAAGRGLDLGLLRKAGKYLDSVSIHYYGDPLWQEDKPSSYAACMCASGPARKVIRLTEQIIAVAGYEGKIGIAFDEWNLRGWHHPFQGTPEAIAERRRNDPEQHLYHGRRGLLRRHPQHLPAPCRHGARWPTWPRWSTGAGRSYVHPGGMVKRTTFHVLQMCRQPAGRRTSPTPGWAATAWKAAKVQALDAVATCDSKRETWNLALVNRDAGKNPDTA